MAVHIASRRDTPTKWRTTNPILLLGEYGIELGTIPKIKAGDGVHPWNDLPYIGDEYRVKYLSATSPSTIPTEYSVVYYRLDMGAESGAVTQSLPNPISVKGMILIIEFLAQSTATLQLTIENGPQLTVLSAPNTYMLLANEITWARFGKDAGTALSDTDIRDALERLNGDDRLTADSVKGLGEFFNTLIQNAQTVINGGNANG